MNDWQTYTALGLVALTAVVFLIRLSRPKKKKAGGCKKPGCGCGK